MRLSKSRRSIDEAHKKTPLLDEWIRVGKEKAERVSLKNDVFKTLWVHKSLGVKSVVLIFIWTNNETYAYGRSNKIDDKKDGKYFFITFQFFAVTNSYF